MNKELLLFTFLSVAKELHKQAFGLVEEIGVHHGQPRLVNLLREKDGRSLSEIAGLLHSETATISKMVKRMEHAGYLVRRSDPNDNRVTRIFLSASGRALGDKIDELHQKMNDLLCAPLSNEEERTLHNILKKIQAAIQENEKQS